MKVSSFSVVLYACLFFACDSKKPETNQPHWIADGQMPATSVGKDGHISLTFGSGDSILYMYSSDRGASFSTPELVGVVPGLFSSHTRGPQIAESENSLCIIACNREGNIFSYYRDGDNKWKEGGHVNDLDGMAKEGLMAMDGRPGLLFAAWLDLRTGHNQIEGCVSTNGGRSWEKNISVYQSPDSGVCECCKPSVAVNKTAVAVMFRNHLHGNRDMYYAESGDGRVFSAATKLGNGNWPLDGCPMDGGKLVFNHNRENTVWRREGRIYACEPGSPETEIGEGRDCSMAIADDKPVFSWVNKGEITCLLPGNRKIQPGKGTLPILTPMDNHRVLCTWENDRKIYSMILPL